MKGIELSVIIPAYNVEGFIEDCLVSVVGQNVGEVEILIVNDGSTDNTLEICKEFEREYENIRVISQENQGLSGARNTGIRNARGKYISFIDSDDYVDITMFQSMMNILSSQQINIIVCGYKSINELREVVYESLQNTKWSDRILNSEEALEAFLYREIPEFAWGKIYKKELFERYKLLYPIDKNFEDGQVTIELLSKAERVYIMSSHFYYYRRRGGGITKQLNRKNILDRFTQYIKQIEMIKSVEGIKINEGARHRYIKENIQILSTRYLAYQYLMFQAKVFAEEIELNQKLVLFGASSLGEKYIDFIQDKFQDVVFVDNDPKKHDTYLNGKIIISLENFKKHRNEYGKIIITSIYIVEIAKQLIDYNVITSLTQIMLLEGKTEIEKAYVEGFEMIMNYIY
jgi:glycosyltransferase involved in cell wall biosynthesis